MLLSPAGRFTNDLDVSYHSPLIAPVLPEGNNAVQTLDVMSGPFNRPRYVPYEFLDTFLDGS